MPCILSRITSQSWNFPHLANWELDWEPRSIARTNASAGCKASTLQRVTETLQLSHSSLDPFTPLDLYWSRLYLIINRMKSRCFCMQTLQSYTAGIVFRHCKKEGASNKVSTGRGIPHTKCLSESQTVTWSLGFVKRHTHHRFPEAFAHVTERSKLATICS